MMIGIRNNSTRMAPKDQQNVSNRFVSCDSPGREMLVSFLKVVCTDVVESGPKSPIDDSALIQTMAVRE